MRKRTNFREFKHKGWPDPLVLRPYFFGPPGEEWFDGWGNDTAAFSIEGLYGTEKGIPGKTRVDLYLHLYGIPGLGVLLFYHKYGGGYRKALPPRAT